MGNKKKAVKKVSKLFLSKDGIEFDFDEALTPDQREMVEQSVAAMIERSRAETDAIRARIAEKQKLLDAINAPIAKLIRADPKAEKALEKFGVRMDLAEDGLQMGDALRGGHDHVIPASPTDRSVEVRVPPYDFAWRWHQGGGDPPFNQGGERDGRLGLDARCGIVAGGADRFVHAHIGVGCIVRLDRPTIIGLSAARSSRHSFVMGAPGLGANATSEGGFETTFMRGGQVLMGGHFPLWHRHITGGEARESTGFGPGVYPNGMGGRFDPGEYAYNVGIYAFADRSSGIGGAGVQSLVRSDILDMRVTR